MTRNLRLVISLLGLGWMLLGRPAVADSGWFWQNPLPQRGHLRSAVMLNTQTMFAVGDLGRFMKSSDGGVTWTVQSVGNYDLSSISMYRRQYVHDRRRQRVCGDHSADHGWRGHLDSFVYRQFQRPA